MNTSFICTVLIVSYNSEKTIARAIDSVLMQESKYRYKIHVFDDGSTDGAPEIIKKYAKKYPNIVFPYLAKKNQGPQTNYWNAYMSVDTPYCVCLDGDDFFCHKKKIELQVEALENHPECSFCGHDTYLFSEGESFREYEEGSKAMTAPILREKSIFNYEDFKPITTGGYISYCTARMIRTSVMNLDKIKYKEAFLFDFCQFYFLLLKGDYYYIDLPMTVYVRNGTGICSGKSHTVFLNDFLQSAIDFNKETNNIIADKIYSDCRLQIDFRLMLFSNTPMPIVSSAAQKKAVKLELDCMKVSDDDKLLLFQQKLSSDMFYFLCNGGLGHTMFLCSYKDKLEEHIGGKITLLIREEQEFIAQGYKITDYLCVSITNVNLEFLGTQCPLPEKGKIYVAHPYAHPESTSYYLPIYQQISTVRYLPWLLKYYGLPLDSSFVPLEFDPQIPRKLRNKINRCGGDLNKMVLFFPESLTFPRITKKVWKEKAKELSEEGLTVLSCVTDRLNTVEGTQYIEITAEEAVILGTKCHSIYCLRSGIADLLSFRGKDLHVYYYSHATWFIYSLNAMFKRNDIDEKIVLELEPQPVGYVPPPIVSNPVIPKKAYAFGFIPVPQWVYRFYTKHKASLKKFKRFVKWR